MPKKGKQEETRPVKIRSAVDLPDVPQVVHDPDPFEKYIEDKSEFQKKEMSEKQRRQDFYRHLRRQAFVPIVCVIVVCVMLFLYSTRVHDKVVASAKKEAATLQRQNEDLKTEIVSLEKIKAEIYADPKVLKELQVQERKSSSEQLIADKFSIIISKLRATSTNYTDTVTNRARVSDAIGLAAGLFNDLDGYERTFGAGTRSNLVTKLVTGDEAKTQIAYLHNACIRGGGFTTDVYFRTGLIVDYLMLLSTEYYRPAEVLEHFNRGLSRYSEALQWDDYHKITEAIGVAEASIHQVPKH